MVKSYLPTSTIMRKRDGVNCPRVYIFLGWWHLIFSQEWWGYIRYGVFGPQPFATGGNKSYPKVWAVTGGLWYPGY
jgi:hypothetical protein